MIIRMRACTELGGGGPSVFPEALTSGNVQQSAVAEHATNEMHDIDWEKAEVVDCHPHYRQRCALEAWHIRTEPHKMNRDGGPLPAVYNPLIRHPRRPY